METISHGCVMLLRVVGTASDHLIPLAPNVDALVVPHITQGLGGKSPSPLGIVTCPQEVF